MQIFFDEMATRYPTDNGVMVLDGAGGHKSKDFNLREKHFHNRVFDSIDALEDHLVSALRNLENRPDRVKSITGWDWIINSISIANWN